MLGIAQWRFQGSNDGVNWTTIDMRNTERTENPDIPINLYSGSTYYFDNEESYTHYRWLIDKMVPGSDFLRFSCFGLFVLEENPFLVRPIYQLSRTAANGDVLTAYTYDEGTAGVNIANDTTVWTDVKWTEPVENIWAYEVTDNDKLCWVFVPGNSGDFVPEASMVYIDYDFTEEYVEALVDTWTYTGNINKKFAYTGTRLQDFTWDQQEPYNKYVYTGEIANQYKYTGKIEGWAYTGVKEDIYDTVPNFHLSLNRDDVRTITKRTSLGMAYPVTDTANPTGTTFYSYSAGDIPGAIVPEGTPLYNGINDTESSVTADGTDAYIFSTAPAEARYTYEHLYVRNNDALDGTTLTDTDEAFYDVNLTELAEGVDLTQYYYDSERTPSHMADFYHRITEDTPKQNYNLGLSFDGSGYTFNCYADGGTTDIQTLAADEPVKSSYQGAADETKDTVVLIARPQNLIKLNLTKSVYGWWTWNGLTEKTSQQTTANVFRLGKINGGASYIDEIYELYPWRIQEINSDTRPIGDPIITLNSKLEHNEIWLEGQELPKKKYVSLYKVYGDTYGTPTNPENFLVPNFINRSVWGAKDFGYISGALPNITGNPGVRFRHANDSYSDQITGALRNVGSGGGSWKGGSEGCDMLYLNASWSSPLYKDNVNYVQPTSVAVRVKTRFA